MVINGATTDDGNNIPVIKHKCVSDVQFGHHQVITDLQWLPGIEITARGKANRFPGDSGRKECDFFATVAVDGKVLFWDVRVERLLKRGRRHEELADLVWKPTHMIHLVSLIGLDLGGTRFCLDPVALESRPIIVGSFDGEITISDCFRMGDEETPDFIHSSIQSHVGPIVSLERSPFFEDILLTVGDWTFQIWKQGLSAPLFHSRYSSEYYTVGCWSPTRAGVIYLATMSGRLEVWDLLDRSHEPSIGATLSAA
eukprot:CAMPEP_0175053992 /NCGR_PEP_ID=MMETSP0052_2-20121109/9244_1 /TAXON_ID=51329 ORGANISM="Polytomella parva, Strain SAG 63-3" /NCGR_SAMPLE_ID=MMETSP0052_2 /ASSEMBLY_ACC=CAM_ASM_000194 /LENGTH=254 /DNA_ID=CAMNT_0016318611 /DNA_START=324 /DNA_END=1085 /DNA_ORIENTATION=+